MNNVIITCSNIFLGSDSYNWAKVKNSFADEVLLDYSSGNLDLPALVQKNEVKIA